MYKSVKRMATDICFFFPKCICGKWKPLLGRWQWDALLRVLFFTRGYCCNNKKYEFIGWGRGKSFVDLKLGVFFRVRGSRGWSDDNSKRNDCSKDLIQQSQSLTYSYAKI